MRRGGPDERTKQARRTRQIEAIALGLLAALPVLPYLTFLLRADVPRFGLFGDLAGVEYATRHVGMGDALVGGASRLGLAHPGPAFFYVAAPFQAAFGPKGAGLHVAACVVNALAAATIASSARLFARRPHAISVLLLVLAWFVGFGNVVANPWGPVVIVLPLLAFLVASALLARGKSAALYPAVVFGALVSQTWGPAAPVVIVCGLAGVLGFLVGARRRGRLAREERWRLAVAAALLLTFSVPPLVDQVISPEGNIVKLLRFVFRRPVPLGSLGVAVQHWATTTSWLPERAFGRALLDDGLAPTVVSTVPMAGGLTSMAKTIALVHVGTMALAAIVATRRRDVVSLAFVAFGALASAVAILCLQGIVGPARHYLAFWLTAASTVAWMGVLSTVFSIVATGASRLPRASIIVVPGLVVLGLAVAVMTTSFQRHWLARHPDAPGSEPALRADLRSLHGALRTRLTRDQSTPVIHLEGAWDLATAMALELEKDQVDVRFADADRWAFPGGRGGRALERPLHLWLATTKAPLPLARCLELVARSGELSVYGAPAPVSRCARP